MDTTKKTTKGSKKGQQRTTNNISTSKRAFATKSN